MKKNLLFLVVGILISFLVTTTVRFITLKDHDTHYHANWAVYIDGKKFDFSDDLYQEEIASCGDHEILEPTKRVHLHNNNGDVVHVHHDGVTWGHLMSNLGFTLSPQSLIDEEGKIYTDGNGKQLSFILNGKPIANPYNTLIKSTDRLLINFGTEKETELGERFDTVANNAHEYNSKNDPASCSGEHETFWDKIKRAIIN